MPAGVLGRSRGLALLVIAALVAAASLMSFAESYRALHEWAAGHGLSGRWAVIWPLQVDVFIAGGELALFVALADGWQLRSRIGAWLVTLAGLAVSVAGNVGHVASHALADRATPAVPPLAARILDRLSEEIAEAAQMLRATAPRNEVVIEHPPGWIS